MTVSSSPDRLVLDTNAWLDLLLFADPRCDRLAQALADGRALALVDAACREEWLRVLEYPVLQLDPAQRLRLVQRFDATATALDGPLRALPLPPLPRCRDADDQKFLALACAADASVLLTRDAALLALARRTERSGLFRICRPEEWVGSD